MASITKNFAFSILNQMVSIFVPFVIAPYAARILGADGIGVYSYTYSIASYFLLFAMLGIVTHGNRTVAAIRQDKERLSKCFANIYAVQFLSGVIACISYIVYIFLFAKEYHLYLWIQLPLILSSLFDISWFFAGLENFRLTVQRSIGVKVVSLVLILLLVKQTSDLWKYTFIMSASLCLSQLALWRYLPKEITWVKPDLASVKENLRPIFVLFIPVLSFSLYRIMDKIMIGKISTVTEVGIYECAEKIVNIPVGITNALGSVMLPRMSYLAESGDNQGHLRYMENSISFISLINGAICFGISAVSDTFVLLYYGQSFEKTAGVLCVLIFSALFSGWASVIRTQLLIPMKMDSCYVLSMLMAAAINFVLNMCLIPQYGAVGATLGTIMAEIIILLVQCCAVRKMIDLPRIFRHNLGYLLMCGLMFSAVLGIDRIITAPGIGKLLLEIFVGVLVWGVLFIVKGKLFGDPLYTLIIHRIKKEA